jgi:hypothetical protein
MNTHLQKRVERLEQAVDIRAVDAPQVVIYQPDERPELPESDGRARVFLPDNQRGSN